MNGEQDRVCRLCLNVDENAVPIFSKDNATLESQIRDCCPVELSKEDRLPKVICKECKFKITSIFEFRRKCRESDAMLRKFCRSSIAPRTTSFAKPIRSITTTTTIATVATTRSRTRARPATAKDHTGESQDSTVSLKLVPTEDPEILRDSYQPEVTSKARESSNTGEFLCDICSKKFASKSGLRLHLKAHSGLKPFVCTFCDKSFAILSYLKRHEMTHSTEKQYICHVCSASFASRNGLRYHLRVHSDESQFTCEICGKGFKRFKYLKEHTFVHTGEKPFVCKFCQSAYGNSGTLFVHEKKCRIIHSRDRVHVAAAKQ